MYDGQLSGRVVFLRFVEDVSFGATNRLMAADVFMGNFEGLGTRDPCFSSHDFTILNESDISRPVSSFVGGVPCSVCSLSLTYFVDTPLRSAV